MQLRLWSSSYFTVATGVHTCTSLVFHICQVLWINWMSIAIGWIIHWVISEHHEISDVIHCPHSQLFSSSAHVNVWTGGISCGIAQQYCAKYFVLHLLPVCSGLSLTVNCSKQPLHQGSDEEMVIKGRLDNPR